MIHSSTRADAETSYLRETYRFDRDLESAVAKFASAQCSDIYGFPVPHNFRGGAWSIYIAR
jgi:hypothetical protein